MLIRTPKKPKDISPPGFDSWAELVKALTAWHKQNVIGKLCGVSAQNISALAGGDIKEPSYSLGVALVALYRDCRDRPPWYEVKPRQRRPRANKVRPAEPSQPASEGDPNA